MVFSCLTFYVYLGSDRYFYVSLRTVTFIGQYAFSSKYSDLLTNSICMYGGMPVLRLWEAFIEYNYCLNTFDVKYHAI